MTPKVIYEDLGLIDFKEAWDYQTLLFDATIAIKMANRRDENNKRTTSNYLLFCEHPHVFTLGKSGKETHLLLNENSLKARGATYYKINRGGDITYHGPGQLVAYPILDLDHFFTDIHKYLRLLEEAVIVTLAEYDITAERVEGLTGVWIDGTKPTARKICAMGVKCSRWVTMHGIALNVKTDLSYFKNIVPCGINNKAVTSIQHELGKEIDMNEVKQKLKINLSKVFNYEIV
jgi:lipoyl(octanoyl) transferase